MRHHEHVGSTSGFDDLVLIVVVAVLSDDQEIHRFNAWKLLFHLWEE
jgi:hypothetical protein